MKQRRHGSASSSSRPPISSVRRSTTKGERSHSISSSAVFSSDTSTPTPGASARRSAVNARCYVSGKREGLVAPELVEWREFFVTTATVAGALVGLLFIAISLHLPLLSDDRHADLRLDARSILIGYVFALALSLLPLIPQSLAALGEELLVLFLYMIATTIWAVPRLLRTRTALYGR